MKTFLFSGGSGKPRKAITAARAKSLSTGALRVASRGNRMAGGERKIVQAELRRRGVKR